MKVCVIGSGNWGTAIFNLLKMNGISAKLISRNNLEELKKETFDIGFIALRTEAIEEFLQHYIQFLPKSICSISKGIFTEKMPFLSEKMHKEGFDFAILSGPNFAEEVERKEQTITTIASTNKDFSFTLKRILETDFFKIEMTEKVISIEIFAIFKNIIAIFTGFMEKNNFSANTKSMIFTFLVKEMIDFTKQFDSTSETFFLSAGIGDIFLTSTSSQSRNFEYGYNFDFNSKQEAIKTVEGLRSLRSIPYLEEMYGFKFSFYNKLYKIIIEKQNISIF